MIERKDFYLFGKILKLHGFSGHLLVKADSPLKTNFKKSEPLFLEIDGILVPFFILESTQTANDNYLLLLEDIDSDSSAKEFVGCSIYLPPGKKGKDQNPAGDLFMLEGYSLFDSKGAYTGKVEEVVNIPQNKLFRVVLEEKEYLLPANDDFIIAIDHKKKEIHYQITEGLLDI